MHTETTDCSHSSSRNNGKFETQKDQNELISCKNVGLHKPDHYLYLATKDCFLQKYLPYSNYRVTIISINASEERKLEIRLP